MIKALTFTSIEDIWNIIISEASLTPISKGSNEYAIFGDPSVRLVLKAPTADDQPATIHIRSVEKENVFSETNKRLTKEALPADFDQGTVNVVKGINGTVLFNIRYDRDTNNEMREDNAILLSKTAEGKALALFSYYAISNDFGKFASIAYSGRPIQQIDFGHVMKLGGTLTNDFVLVKMPVPESSDNLTDVYVDFGGLKNWATAYLINNAKFVRCSRKSVSGAFFSYFFIQVKD